MRDIECEQFHTDHIETELAKIIKAPKENRLWELIPNGKPKNSPIHQLKNKTTQNSNLNLKYLNTHI